MTTDKERAEVYRELAAELPTEAYWSRPMLTRKADELDPPKGDSAPGSVTKVEPLRVLGDDEVAVKRTKADYFGADSDNWRIEASGVAHHHPAAAYLLCRSYADALAAEAGEQS